MRLVTIVVEDVSRPGHVFRASQIIDRNILLGLTSHAMVSDYFADTIKMLCLQVNDEMVKYDHEKSKES